MQFTIIKKLIFLYLWDRLTKPLEVTELLGNWKESESIQRRSGTILWNINLSNGVRKLSLREEKRIKELE